MSDSTGGRADPEHWPERFRGLPPPPRPAYAVATSPLECWIARATLAIATGAVIASIASWLVPASTNDIREVLLFIPTLLSFPAWLVMILLLTIDKVDTDRGLTHEPLTRYVPRWMWICVPLLVVCAVASAASSRPRGSASIRDGQFTIYLEKPTGNRPARIEVVSAEVYAAERQRESRLVTAFSLGFACPPAFVGAGACRRKRARSTVAGTPPTG